MSLAKQVFTQLDDITYSFREYYVPKPSYAISNNDETTIIISAVILRTLRSRVEIYKLNLETNKMTFIDDIIDVELVHHGCHGQYFDNRTQILYLFGGDEYAYCEYNLNTAHAEVNLGVGMLLGLCSISTYPSVTSIPSLNQLHVMDKNCHYTFDHETSENMHMPLGLNNIEYPKPMFIPYKNQLMLFGSDGSDKIFYKDISKNGVYNVHNEWKLYPLNMPHIIDDNLKCDLLLSFETILFLFYSPASGYCDIWCLDFMSNHFYKSSHKTPTDKTREYRYSFKGSNNSVHIIDFYSGQHFEASLIDLIPTELTEIYRKYYDPLIKGYIKEMENKKIIPTIPYVLKQLILNYFPSFL